MSVKIDRTGEIGFNKFGSKMIITEYRNSMDIIVRFDKGDYTHTSYAEFKKGKVKSVNDKSVFGVGFIGEGIYSTSENGKHTKIYSCWKSMMERCYSLKFKNKHRTYIDCVVADEWHNFQNFAKWYEENYYTIINENLDLDKDILCKGNKTYSKETCVFVPKRINTLFVKCDSKRGSLPVGVSYNKQMDKYQSRYRDENGNRISIGYFNNKEDAFLAYKTHKENVVKQIAEIYKNFIPKKLYNALINYTVNIND